MEKARRYFIDCLEQDAKERQMLANIVGAAVYAFGTAPQTRAIAQKQQQAWKKLIDSLDVDKAKQRMRDRKNPIKALAIAGIPVFVPKESDD